MRRRPKRVLMTLDAVGGVWRYAVDLAQALNRQGIGCLLVGSGPRPDDAMSRASAALSDTTLIWTDAPLDWMAADETALENLPALLTSLARDHECDLLHLNQPSQAAGLAADLPVLVVSHSCVPSWWETMRDTPLPAEWVWQRRRNRSGLDRADGVLAPSASHAALLAKTYGPIERLTVVHNATAALPSGADKEPFVLAAGRWWDEGKNARALDRAARSSPWPVMMAGPQAGPNGELFPIEHATAIGELPSSELLKLMRRAAIFCAPSCYEPFGLAVLEAATQHATLVLSDIPTFRELWQDAALFVSPEDEAGLARAIATLAEDASLRGALASRSAAIARHYTPSRQLDGVLAAYAGVMMRHDQMRYEQTGDGAG